MAEPARAERALPQDADCDAHLRDALELETKPLVSKIVDEDSSVLEQTETDFRCIGARLERFGLRIMNPPSLAVEYR